MKAMNNIQLYWDFYSLLYFLLFFCNLIYWFSVDTIVLVKPHLIKVIFHKHVYCYNGSLCNELVQLYFLYNFDIISSILDILDEVYNKSLLRTCANVCSYDNVVFV